MTMRGISRFIAETLDSNAEFIALATDLAGAPFTYYVNVDITQVDGGLELPYFAVVTFQDQDEVELRKSFKTQLLIGIGRDKPEAIGGIFEEPTLDKVESLSRKAVELLRKEIRAFGIQGETNIKVAYVGFYVPTPDGEDDLQIQVDIEFEQDKFLSC